MILTDGTHLVSDASLEELHRFAKRLELKESWFQCFPSHRVPHYDLTSLSKKLLAIKLGAVFVPQKELVKRAVR